MIKRIVPMPELKQVVANEPDITVSNQLGDLLALTEVSAAAPLQFTVGSGSAQRIGTEIWIKKITVRMTAFTTLNQRSVPVRIIFFIDTEGGGLTTTEMFDQNAGPFFPLASAAGYSINYAYNEDLVGKDKRWRILSDRTYSYPVSGTGSLPAADNGFHQISFTHTFPFKGMKCVLPINGINGDVFERNAIYMWTVGANSATTGINRLHEITKSIWYYDA